MYGEELHQHSSGSTLAGELVAPRQVQSKIERRHNRHPTRRLSLRRERQKLEAQVPLNCRSEGNLQVFHTDRGAFKTLASFQ